MISYPIVHTKYQPIEGQYFTTSKDFETQYFLGVPYARPPIGNLRHKKPQFPSRSESVLSCQKFASRSLQKDDPLEQNHGVPNSEDCLYLNIFGPKNSEDGQKYPVIVFIHGGSCINGSPVAYGDTNICENLCSNGVVVATVQYRLGFLGLLYLDDEATPDPNLCLWDLKMALEWVHENIGKFHGDSGNVTVMGHSSGSALVEFLCVSPGTKHLIHKSILLAGNRFIIQVTKEILRERFVQFLKSSGWKDFSQTRENHSRIMNFLSCLPPEKFRLKHDVDLAPVIDTELLPFKTLKEMQDVLVQIPVIMGGSELEGLLFAYFSKSNLEDNDVTYESLLKSVSQSLGLEHDATTKNWQRMRQYYEKLINSGKRDRAIIELIGDWVIHENAYRFLDLHKDVGNSIFLYMNEQYNEKSFKYLEGYTKIRGATHATELAYIFGRSTHLPFDFTEDDRKVSEFFAQIITNFAYTADPNKPQALPFKWPPASVDHSWTCCIGTNIRIEKEYNQGKRFT